MLACWLVHHTHLVLVRTRTAQKRARASSRDGMQNWRARQHARVHAKHQHSMVNTKTVRDRTVFTAHVCVCACARASVLSGRRYYHPLSARTCLLTISRYLAVILRARARAHRLCPTFWSDSHGLQAVQAAQAVRSRRRPTMAQYFNAQIYSHNTHASHAKRKACDDAHIHYGSARAIRHR